MSEERNKFKVVLHGKLGRLNSLDNFNWVGLRPNKVKTRKKKFKLIAELQKKICTQLRNFRDKFKSFLKMYSKQFSSQSSRYLHINSNFIWHIVHDWIWHCHWAITLKRNSFDKFCELTFKLFELTLERVCQPEPELEHFGEQLSMYRCWLRQQRLLMLQS